MRGGARDKRSVLSFGCRQRFSRRVSSALVLACLLRLATITAAPDRECLYSAGADSPSHAQRLALMPSLLSFGLWVAHEERRANGQGFVDSLQKGAQRFSLLGMLVAIRVFGPARPRGAVVPAAQPGVPPGGGHRESNLSRAPPTPA